MGKTERSKWAGAHRVKCGATREFQSRKGVTEIMKAEATRVERESRGSERVSNSGKETVIRNTYPRAHKAARSNRESVAAL